MTPEIVAKAKAIAHRAHFSQTDKAGRPYIEHVARVAAACADDPMAEAVAWVHDVLEDCPKHVHLLRELPNEVQFEVELLTHIPGWSRKAYYTRIRNRPTALKVKLADIADNADENRLSLLAPHTADRLRAKYAKARIALGEAA